MSKSNYPQAIDTSVELPAVRNNITEIAPDLLNGLRSAIIQIERTLGINPQGATGQTLSARLNNLIDQNGNLLASAISSSNLISGDIVDANISKSASISETKLNLDFPSKLLQSQLLTLDSAIKLLIAQLNALNSEYIAHISPIATARHTSENISTAQVSAVSSGIATMSLAGLSLQATLEEFYSKHILYDGLNTSAANNSHTASQVYVDSSQMTNVAAINLQGALEDLDKAGEGRTARIIRKISSNGVIRNSLVSTNTFKISNAQVSYITSQGSDSQTIILSTPTIPLASLNTFDIITISGSTDISDNAQYVIKSFVINPSSELISVTVFGGPKFNSTGTSLISIQSRPFLSNNVNAINCAIRPRFNPLNTSDIVISTPGSATIISIGISSDKLTSTNSTFSISIDGGGFIDIDCFKPSAAVQTVWTVSSQINLYAVNNNLPISAYILRANNCFEIAISHHVPLFDTDSFQRTLEISNGSVNDGLSTLGLALTGVISGTIGHGYLLNGNAISSSPALLTLTSVDASIALSAITLNAINPIHSGVRVGDTVIISGSTNPTDNGSFIVASVTQNVITVESNGITFSGSLDLTSTIMVIRRSVLPRNLIFNNLTASFGSILFDAFIDSSGDYNLSKRLEINGEIQNANITIGISDISRGFLKLGDVITLTSDIDGSLQLSDQAGFVGPKTFALTSGRYHVFWTDKFSFITIDIETSALPAILSSIEIFGHDQLPLDTIILSRGLFSTSLGGLISAQGEFGVPILTDKRSSGTVGVENINQSVIEKYIEGPRNELRSSGVISGLSSSNFANISAGRYSVDVAAGVAVVSGIRYEVPAKIGFQFSATTNGHLAVDENGCIVFAAETISVGISGGFGFKSYFSGKSVAILAYIDLASATNIIDSRLNISLTDLKANKEITVSPEPGLGQFTTIKAAVDYARLFNSIYPLSGTPSVKILAGEYTINSLILIDFDLNIEGSGAATVIIRSDTFATGNPGGGSLLAINNYHPAIENSIFLIGGSETSSSSRIINGVSISKIAYFSSQTVTGTLSFITITQSITPTDSQSASFRFSDISFNGPTSIIFSTTSIGEFLVSITRATANPTVQVAGIEMGNVFITNCFLRYSGIEFGAAFIQSDSANNLRNFVAYGNISEHTSPVLGVLNQIYNLPLTGIPTLVSETGNIIT